MSLGPQSLGPQCLGPQCLLKGPGPQCPGPHCHSTVIAPEFHMVFVMAAICLDFKWPGFRISDSIPIWTICNPTSF